MTGSTILTFDLLLNARFAKWHQLTPRQNLRESCPFTLQLVLQPHSCCTQMSSLLPDLSALATMLTWPGTWRAHR